MSEYAQTPKKILVELNVVSSRRDALGKLEYIVGRTPGMRIDDDRCIHISADKVKGDNQ